jgi:dTDP-4-amino-4,6-dideoxygalactose transaminase
VRGGDAAQSTLCRGLAQSILTHWNGRATGTVGQIAALYRDGIRNPAIRVPNAGQGSNGHLLPVFVEASRKAAFLTHLRERGITPGEHYPACIFEQKALEGLPVEMAGDCGNAVRLCRSEVSLPIHPYLSGDEVAGVIDACNGFS